MRPDGVYFEHGAPRGPGSANAYVLFEANVPAATYLQQINAHIRDGGNHGHGDDLVVFVMPETLHDVSMTYWPVPNLTTDRREALQANIEQFVRAAFRESTQSDYQPTLTLPNRAFPSAAWAKSCTSSSLTSSPCASITPTSCRS